MKNIRYEILTQRLPDSQVIAQQVNQITLGGDPADPMQEHCETIMCQMINLADESIRSELIKLGWTPPNTIAEADARLRAAAIDVCMARRAAGGIAPQLHNAIAQLTAVIKETQA